MRASVWLFGRELLSFEIDWQDDDPAEPKSREPAAPVETTSVPGPGAAMADTAFGDHTDPDVRHIGFGHPLRPTHPYPDRTAPDDRDGRGLLFGFIPEGGD